MRFLRRVAIILAAFVASAAAAGAAFIVFFPILSADTLASGDGVLQVVAAVAIGVLILTAIPPMIVTAIAEYFAIRHWLYFTAAGGVMAFLFVGALAWLPSKMPDPRMLLALVMAGPVAGCGYWSIAGRRSGRFDRSALAGEAAR